MTTNYPNIRVKLDPGAFLPSRAHGTDAGADLRTPHALTVPAHGSACVDTGVHVELPEGTCGELWSKSGLNVNHGVVSTGLIDEGFTGTIVARLYNLGDEDYTFEKGEKVTQLVVKRVCYPTYELSETIEGGERGDAGYGSTGRM